MAIIGQNYIHEEIKSRLNVANVCYFSFHSIFVSHLPLREEHGLRMF
jgi:hypothetical protein